MVIEPKLHFLKTNLIVFSSLYLFFNRFTYQIYLYFSYLLQSNWWNRRSQSGATRWRAVIIYYWGQHTFMYGPMQPQPPDTFFVPVGCLIVDFLRGRFKRCVCLLQQTNNRPSTYNQLGRSEITTVMLLCFVQPLKYIRQLILMNEEFYKFYVTVVCSLWTTISNRSIGAPSALIYAPQTSLAAQIYEWTCTLNKKRL
jgi:hypothetical protein